MENDLTKNLRVLTDQGFHDFHTRGMPPCHLQLHIENLALDEVEHDLRTLADMVCDLALILHVAPRYDDWAGFDDPNDPFRRVGTMTGMVKLDKGARRVLKSKGMLKRVQGFLENGRPYGTGLVFTTVGATAAVAMAQTYLMFALCPDIDDERLVDKSLEAIRKVAAHFLASIYRDMHMKSVTTLETPQDLTVRFGLPEDMSPLLSAGLSRLADLGLVVKSHNRYRRGQYSPHGYGDRFAVAVADAHRPIPMSARLS